MCWELDSTRSRAHATCTEIWYVRHSSVIYRRNWNNLAKKAANCELVPNAVKRFVCNSTLHVSAALFSFSLFFCRNLRDDNEWSCAVNAFCFGSFVRCTSKYIVICGCTAMIATTTTTATSHSARNGLSVCVCVCQKWQKTFAAQWQMKCDENAVNVDVNGDKMIRFCTFTDT